MIQVAQDVGNASNQMVYNTTAGSNAITIPAAGVTIDLTGQELFGTPTTVFANGTAYNVANFTIDEGVSTTTGVKTIRLTSVANVYEAGENINITYTYGDDGYIDNSGARSMAALIVIMFALAIAVVVLEPTLRSGILNKFGV